MRDTYEPTQEDLDERQAMNMFNLESSYNKIASQRQVGGTHYKNKPIQPWDYVLANDLGYLEGNIIKYTTRWKDKGGLQDLKKAQHYLQKLIETNS